MFNYDKIHFNEKDEGRPVQYFFFYDITESELDRFLAYYVDEEQFSGDLEVKLQELCLTEFSKDDYRLEGIFNLSNGMQSWVTLYDTVSKDSVSKLLEKINE